MRRLTSQEVQLISILILAFLAVLVGNLVENLQSLPRGDDAPPPPIVPAVDEGPITVALRLIIIALGTITIVGIAALAIDRLRKRRKRLGVMERMGMPMYNNPFLVSMAMIMVAFGILFLLRRGSIDPPGGTNEGELPGGAMPNVIPGVQTAGVPAIPLGVVILVIVVAALLGLNLVRHRRTAPGGTTVQARKETAEEVSQALYQLELGGDARPAILQCYRKMGEIMGRHGVENPDHMTPREFRSSAAPLLGLREGSLRRLTGLFEVARYSHYSVGEGEREEATACLREIRGELGD